MAIVIACPACSRRLQFRSESSDRPRTCPVCGYVLGQGRQSPSAGQSDPGESATASSGAKLATGIVLAVVTGLSAFFVYGRFVVWQQQPAGQELAKASAKASETQPRREGPSRGASPPAPEAAGATGQPAAPSDAPPAPPASEPTPQQESASSAQPPDPKPAAPVPPVEEATASTKPAQQPVTKDTAHASEPGKESAKGPEPEEGLGSDKKSAQEPGPGTDVATGSVAGIAGVPNLTRAASPTPPTASGQQSLAGTPPTRPLRRTSGQHKQWTEEELLGELTQMPDLLVNFRLFSGSAGSRSAGILMPTPGPFQAPSFVVVSEAQVRRQIPGWTEGVKALAHPERVTEIAAASLGVRQALSAASQGGSAARDSLNLRRGFPARLTQTSAPTDVDAQVLRAELQRQRKLLYRPEAVSSLCQILGAETRACRLVLVEILREIPGKEATAGLVQLALFDVAEPVRQAAIEALQSRPADSYRQQLLTAIRYPWLPVSYHAAEALVALDDKEAVPALLDLLKDRSDPRALYPGQREAPLAFAASNRAALQAFPGEPLRLEVVKVNHLSNCLLCHALATGNSGPLVAPVPAPSSSVDPRSVEYYSSVESTTLLARADIVKLRQDFSTTLAVPEGVPGPNKQRFDFLVLSRPMTAGERVAFSELKEPQHVAPVLFALRELTGQDLGKDPAKWISHLRSGSEGEEGFAPGR